MALSLLNPRASFRYDEHPIAPRPSSLNGIVLGLIDSSKDNADVFLHTIEKELRMRYDIERVHHIKKPISSEPADIPEEFFNTCHAVVNAFGD